MLIILATFTIPIIFTIRFEDGEKNVKETGETVKNIGNNELDEEKKENFAQNGASLMGENYEYKRYGTVKVLHTKDNSIEEMKMDEYLLGVVSAEMPADFEEEALKAQAVVARTYTVYKIEHNQSKHGEADICDNSACCQAWISKDDRMARWDEDKRESNWEKIEKAVSSTAGKVVTYNGEVIDAFFHSNSGGKTEEVSNVWGGSDLPYLQSVETAGEDAYSQYQSEAIFTKEEFEKKIKEKYQEFTIDYKDENCIKVIEYTQGDRVKTIKIGNLELSGVEVRSLLALRSANFTTQISENEIKFTVKGYGHGVGMSQTGADSMAKQGSNYEEIIKHYYTGVEITNL
jgi:stage II sporulation protein D